MTIKTIEMTHEQIESIIVEELIDALIHSLEDYNNRVKVYDTRKQHRRLIESIHRTLAYYMDHDSFVNLMSENDIRELWDDSFKRDPFDWV